MFSQHDEERYILGNTPTIGRFLSIGEWSGETFSNVRALALNGWSGTCVEPSPGPFCALVELYRHNEKIKLVNALVDPSAYGLKKFYSTADAISTTEEKLCEKWGGVKNFREIYTAQVPVAEVLDGFYDFVSIDTEGSSVSILKAISLSDRTNLVCVEHDMRLNEVEEHFRNHGVNLTRHN